MRVKLFTLRYSPTLGGFDETPLQEFLRGKEVLSFRENFFHVSDVPHLACVVTYQEPVVPVAAAAAAARPERSNGAGGGRRERPPDDGRPDPAAGLDEAGRLLFNTLREWRAATARRDGVPPYVILTNRELVRVVAARPESLNALGNVEGIGRGKVERYGGAILSLLTVPAPEPAAPAAGAAP